MRGRIPGLNGLIKQVALAMYPVGSIHIRVDGIDPEALFGGTWERYAQGRVMIGTDTAHPLGSVGGEETHMLTTAEMPAHEHAVYMNDSSVEGYYWGPNTVSPQTGAVYNSTGHAGGGQPHNNMPPYIAVAIWRRTA